MISVDHASLADDADILRENSVRLIWSVSILIHKQLQPEFIIHHICEVFVEINRFLKALVSYFDCLFVHNCAALSEIVNKGLLEGLNLLTTA